MRSGAWMRSLVVMVVVIAALGAGAVSFAGVEQDVAGRWLGAWVVTRIETYSECSGTWTGNRVNGMLVSTKRGRRFQPGELGKVVKVDASRSRIDLKVALAERVLKGRQDGPFRLYDEASCQMELQIEVPRASVKGGDIDGLDRHLARLLERHPTEDQARAAGSWNERHREAYPDDYEQTLRAHATWRAEQHNRAVQARLDLALQETTRVTERVGSDPDYLRGFAAGVEAARALDLGECPQLLAFDLKAEKEPVAVASAGAAPTAHARGRRDGRLLVVGLELVRQLPGCFIDVP